MAVIGSRTGAARMHVDIDQAALGLVVERDSSAYVLRKAEEVAQRARDLAPVRTGALKGSIRVQRSRNTLGRYSVGYDVTANTPYAYMVHEGTRPHIIRPRRAGGFLRFEVDGRVVFARSVNHPGTRGVPYLTDALREVIGGSA